MEKVCDSSFAYCTGLRSICVPQTAERIGPGAFEGTTFLDADGEELPNTADALSGHVFAGSGGALRLVS